MTQRAYSPPDSGNFSVESGTNTQRPTVSLVGDVVMHKYIGEIATARVVLRKNLISVACTDVTPEALRHLLREHEKAFPESIEIVLQKGK